MRPIRHWLASVPLLVLRARLSLLLHVAQLLLAAIVLLPLSRAFEATFGWSVAGRETGAGRFLEWAWQDLRLNQGDLLAVAERAFSGVAAVGLFLGFTLLSGGAFAVLARPGARGSARDFLAGAGRLFGRYARLFVLFGAGCVALFWANRGLTNAVDWLISSRLERASSSVVVGWLLHAKSLLALLLLGWLITATGLAKARAALADAESPDARVPMLRLFLSSLRTTLTNPVSSAILAAFGPAMLAGSLAAYVWLRGRLDAGATTGLLGRDAPTWILLLAITQVAGWLMQAATVVWSATFLRVARGLAPPPPPPEPVDPLARLEIPFAEAAALLVLVAGLAPLAAAQEQDGAPRAPDGATARPPFDSAYRIVAALDAGKKSIEGVEDVTFTNVGPRPLDELVFHLWMNAFSGPETTFLRERRVRVGRDPLAGVPESALGRCLVTRVTAAGGAELTARVDETLLRVALPRALTPGGRVTLTLAFTTKLPSIELSGRGGFFGDHFGGMQWFPKLAARRGDGFDAEPFHADTEFFGDYGSWDVTLITPKGFVVGATGRLVEHGDAAPSEGPGSALKEPLERRRFLANAVHDFAWCADPNFVPFTSTFDYPSHSVAITYLCQPYAKEKAELVLETARRCLLRYGEWFEPYPYDTLTIDGVPMGLGGGMEYPTLFTISQAFPNHLPWLANATEEPAGVTAHEFGHQFWYGLVASDPLREAWLDEGVNVYVTTKVEQDFWQERERGGRALQGVEWSRVAQPFLGGGLSFTLFGRELGLAPLIGFEQSPFSATRRGKRSEPTLLGFAFPSGMKEVGAIRFLGRRETFVPLAGAAALADVSFDLEPDCYVATTYSKGALALATLEGVFGWDAVREALREHVRRHRFTHPTGAQFLEVLREVLPREAAKRAAEVAAAGGVAPEVPDVEIFLRELWSTRSVLDLAVAAARSRPLRAEPGAPPSSKTEHQIEVVIENRGTMQLPAPIVLRFADGSVQRERWPGDRRFLTIDRRSPSPLVSAEIDPDHALLVDVDWSNNGRTVARNTDTLRRFDVAALFWIETALTLLRQLSGP
jgi:hypothetical protein